MAKGPYATYVGSQPAFPLIRRYFENSDAAGFTPKIHIREDGVINYAQRFG